MTRPHAIEIVGGGLAGLSLGLALRRSGVPTTVFEGGNYPRHRVCGEFITGLDENVIAELGLAPLLADAPRHREIGWYLDGRLARAETLPVPAIGISRYALDARLADAFVAAGGELHCGRRVLEANPKIGRVFATGRRRGGSDLAAGLPAPGAPVRSPRSATSATTKAQSWLGLKLHVRKIDLQRDLELHLGRDAYVGLSVVEDGSTNVCGLFRRRRLANAARRRTLQEAKAIPAPGSDATGSEAGTLFDYLEASGLDRLAARLPQSEIVAGSFCAVAALEFDARVAPRDRVCVGDACAMIPPFTGNGMAMAFQSAVLARDPLVQFALGQMDWTSAVRTIHALLRTHFRVRLASADVLHPFLLRPARQRWFAALSRIRLLPFRPLYAALH